MVKLRTIIGRLETTNLLLSASALHDDMEIAGLVHDSRAVGADTLFVAVRGATSDGHLFIDKAVKNGATAIACEAVPEDHDVRFPGTAFLHVSDSRAALAESAAVFFQDPSRAVATVGITGTNGKTTTAYLIHHVLNALGQRCGLIGTIVVDLGEEPVESSLTTPDALELQQAFATMKTRGCTACAMEVSSHALDQQRVRAVDYDVAIFTNLTPEHLDYHGTLESYLRAKKRLFDELKPEAAALYNIDDPAGAKAVADTRAQRVLSYGRKPAADIRIEILESSIRGLHLRFGDREGRFRLVGLFNAYNLAAAYGAAVEVGHEPAEVIEALESAEPVPGRFEQLHVSRDRTVVVDYAHTPDALENVLNTVREVRSPDAALWCVFGCGGDRDRAKRPLMGRIAEEVADRVVVTSDNPRSEDPEAILRDIKDGFDKPADAAWIADRREAIRYVAESSAAGDIIVIAGKGHETVQVIGKSELPFDDREEARKAFGT